jgi:hypothetical protein
MFETIVHMRRYDATQNTLKFPYIAIGQFEDGGSSYPGKSDNQTTLCHGPDDNLLKSSPSNL